MSWVDFLKIKMCEGRGGGVDHSLTNMRFNELPHSSDQNLFPMEIVEYGPPFNLTNSRFNEHCVSVGVR